MKAGGTKSIQKVSDHLSRNCSFFQLNEEQRGTQSRTRRRNGFDREKTNGRYLAVCRSRAAPTR